MRGFARNQRRTPGCLIAFAALLLFIGCADDDESPPPVADFTFDQASGPAHLTVAFTDCSASAEPLTEWNWDFGDSQTSSDTNPVHTYTAPGVFTVTLAVTGPNGSDTAVHTDCITVEAPQILADFSALPVTGAAPLQVQFTDLSACTVPVTSRSWSFGDGGTDTVENPAHIYDTTGTYTVSLTVTTGSGSDGETKTGCITVTQPSKPTGGSGGATGNRTGSYNLRAYRLYVPTTYTDAAPTPLVAAMQGYGDSNLNFFNTIMLTGWKTAADNQNFILMVPDHKNPSRDSFLHLSGGTTLDMPATQGEMTDLLDCIYYGVGASYNVETTAIYWIGFSEGGTFSDLAAWSTPEKLRACAPYAGYASGKTFPIARDIPVYSLCGKTDPFYTGAPAAHQEWVDAGHPENSAWVDGVGHHFINLCAGGPSPETVYTWMAAADSRAVLSGLP